MKNTHHTLIFVLIAILVLVVGFSVLFKSNFKKEKVTETSTQSAVVENKKPSNSSERFYSMKVKAISPQDSWVLPDPVSFAQMFGLKEDPYLSPTTFFESDYKKFGDFYNKNYSGSWYIQLREGNSKDLELKTYKNSFFEITISPIDEKIIPYLKDVQYCEVDNDCKLSSNYCTSGAYNGYRRAATYGCEGSNGATTKEMLSCNLDTQHAVVSFTGSKCIANKCTALGRKITCEEGALP